ncbi:MAG: MBL fold metallo-hydrolase [Akkermansiaceae bacterium]
MKVSVLGSGSGGNATVISCTSGIYLIDVGLSAKQVVLRLEQRGVDPDSLTGIFLTHEHSDHARGLDVFLRNRDIPVYANALTKEALEYGMKSEIRWKVFQTGQLFELSGISVTAFPIPHDAAEPVGFVLESETARFGLVTDVGYITQSMRVHLRGSDALFIEANYDEDLLEADTKRPWATKQRIASRHGHLSNTQAGEFIADIGCEKLSCVLLGHLSSDCNNAAIATETVSPLIAALQVSDLICADQHQPTEWLEFGSLPSKKDVLAALSGDLSQADLF